jgi:hypothetical protein
VLGFARNLRMSRILLPTHPPLDDLPARDGFNPLPIMPWYYAREGQRIGPVADEDLTRLAKDNVVTPSTLVWRHGMTEWQPWGTVVVSALPESALCHGCSRPFLKDDLVSIQGVMVCAACKPVQLQRVREGILPLGTGGIAPAFGSGKRVIIALNNPLPSRCVCCNRPASGVRIRTFYWYPPWIYALIIVPLILILVSLVVRRTIRLEIPLCNEHEAKRRKQVWIGWAWGLSSILGMVLAVVLLNNNQEAMGGFLMLTSLISLVAALIVGQRNASILSIHRIGKETATFNRASPEYIASLPPWPGGPAL